MYATGCHTGRKVHDNMLSGIGRQGVNLDNSVGSLSPDCISCIYFDVLNGINHDVC
jgi:hypothetical protein